MSIRVVYGNFLRGLDDPHGVVLAPTCGVLTRDGSLVMGAGAARALAARLEGIARDLGFRVRTSGTFNGDHWVYGLVVVPHGDHLVGAFQTKGHWRRPASPEIIRLSASKLRAFLEAHADLRAHLAFPGIGLGGLPRERVSAILAVELAPVSPRVVLYVLSGGARS